MKEEKKDKLCKKLKEAGIHVPEILSGMEGLIKVATHSEIDSVVVATVGAIGLLPTLRAIKAGKEIALANKEVLVAAGALVLENTVIPPHSLYLGVPAKFQRQLTVSDQVFIDMHATHYLQYKENYLAESAKKIQR